MPTHLTTETATITTAAIEIRTLTIGRKQVTLAVFRQLREEPLIAEDGTLNGVPWGTVNYHPDKCGDAKEHLHVVWQHGDELRRSYVHGPEKARLKCRLAADYAMALIAEGASQLDGVSPLRVYRSREHGGAVALVNAWGVSFQARIPMSFMYAWEATAWDAEAKRKRAVETEAPMIRPSAEIKAELPADAYKAAWRALNQLPQLFIAV